MKFFFAGYLLMLVGVFVLWSIEPLHRAQIASSIPAETPLSALAQASTVIRSPIAQANTAKKPAATTSSAGSQSPAQTPAPGIPAVSSTGTPASTPAAGTPQDEPAASTTPPASSPETATSTAPATPMLTADQEIARQIETGIHQKINEEREKAGLPPLSLNQTLTILARDHSFDMLEENYFAHNNAAGCSSSCRLTASGYQWSSSGENIYMMNGYAVAIDKAVGMAVDSWMASPGHRANILSTAFSEEGIGIAFEGSKLYATEDFALPR